MVKNPPASSGDMDLIPGSGRSPGGVNGNPFQFACLDNPMDRGAWQAIDCSPWGHYKSDMTELLHFHFSLSHIGGGNGNPLQCSCLENPRDRGAW